MRSIVLNVMFVCGFACVVSSAFLLSIPLGLFALGCPLIAISVHAQLKAVAK
jgi:hypothetical protein